MCSHRCRPLQGAENRRPCFSTASTRGVARTSSWRDTDSKDKGEKKIDSLVTAASDTPLSSVSFSSLRGSHAAHRAVASTTYTDRLLREVPAGSVDAHRKRLFLKRRISVRDGRGVEKVYTCPFESGSIFHLGCCEKRSLTLPRPVQWNPRAPLYGRNPSGRWLREVKQRISDRRARALGQKLFRASRERAGSEAPVPEKQQKHRDSVG